MELKAEAAQVKPHTKAHFYAESPIMIFHSKYLKGYHPFFNNKIRNA